MEQFLGSTFNKADAERFGEEGRQGWFASLESLESLESPHDNSAWVGVLSCFAQSMSTRHVLGGDFNFPPDFLQSQREALEDS